MTQKDNILQELSELKSILATITPQNVYTVPVEYFEGLAAQVLKRIKEIESAPAVEELSFLSPLLRNISKQMPYAVPAGYFEGLEEKFMQSVRENYDYQTPKEELETLSPLLASLKKQIPYSVPRGYFETLPGTQELIEEVTVGHKKPVMKIISITGRKWIRYAAAAVITGVIAMAGVLYINNNVINDPAKSLVKFEKKLTKEIKKTSDKELDEFIQQFSDAGLNGEEKAYNETDTEVKELLKDVPETELKEFLEETSGAETNADDALLMN